MDTADQIVITKSQLIADLQRLGLQADQTVMLHASVKAIGWIVGGPDMVLEAILDVLTPSGTLMMMTSWEDNPYELNTWSEAKQKSYLEECPVFDPATSHADRGELSILTEYLRTRAGSLRSTHPLGSFAAIGAKAAWLVENQPLQYGYGVGSPLAKLHEAGGKVLSLGAPLNTLTLLHYAECIADVPNKKIVHYKMPMLLNGQREWVEIEEYDTSDGIADWDGGDYFETIVQSYLAATKGVRGKVGNAESYLIDAVEVVEFGKVWMETHLG